MHRRKPDRTNRSQRSVASHRAGGAGFSCVRRLGMAYVKWGAAALTLLGIGTALLLYVSSASRKTSVPGPTAAPAPAASYVGAQVCAGCHTQAYEAWRTSHHALAMQEATLQTVRGDFRHTRFTAAGVTSTFFTRAGKFYVNTDGPDGALHDYEIAYTFGITPLQQYLIEFPGGRLQALPLAWDTRPQEAGGQRWFHLSPETTLQSADPLHWTGREQTWNYQCAECHSTDLRKHYDVKQQRYATQWAEIMVSCEACHGPGAAHVAWAQARSAEAPRAQADETALVVRFGQRTGHWVVQDPQRGTAVWNGTPRSTAEVEACARCHARQRPLVAPYPPGRPFLDTHLPTLLAAELYHADGQILGEVYEYGSFVQSRMFRAGVTCTDCHEPHSLGLRAPGNAVCTQCHLPAQFDTPEHHHHAADSVATDCVTCHMPTQTYMIVDPRRDHSFRVPRPDLSVTLGTPNACTGCHQEQTPAWAAQHIVQWYGPQSPARRPHFAAALDAGRRGLPGAEQALASLTRDESQPGIARATALALLPEYLSQESLPTLEAALHDAEPLVRATALDTLATQPLETRLRLAAPRLRDAVRAVRLAAARTLADVPQQALSREQQADFDRALSELIASEMLNADRPEAHLNLANLSVRRGRLADAEAEFQSALELDPGFVPALLNLADLYRSQGREADGERMLERALQHVPDSAETLHALGLLRVRQGRHSEALELLHQAVQERPQSTRLAYVFAIALYDAGHATRAIAVLAEAHRQRPADRHVLRALVAYLQKGGHKQEALRYAEQLMVLTPGEPKIKALVEALQQQAGSP